VRIVVLGGAGWVGRHVTADLASQPEVDEVILADIDAGAAAELARGLGSHSLALNGTSSRHFEQAPAMLILASGLAPQPPEVIAGRRCPDRHQHRAHSHVGPHAASPCPASS
jgi:nucleoside-diphosphate-sugar epimerase